jgi:glycosyltransferase involved in cell wall biosynthesis
MRILLLTDRIPPENRGGAGVVVWRLAQSYRDVGHDVHVITATDGASFRDVRDDIPTYHLHSDYAPRWRAWLSLYNPQTVDDIHRLYTEIQPDVINAHNIHRDLSYYALTLAYRLGIPAVFSSHDVMPFAYHKLSDYMDRSRCGVASPDAYRLSPLYNLKQMRLRYNPLRNIVIRRILSRHVQIRTAPSQALCDAHHANDLPPFVCVHNGIDAAQFQPSDEHINQLASRLNLDGRRVILFAGRLTGAKGSAQLLQALEQIVQQVPDTVLLALSSHSIASQINPHRYGHLIDDHIVSGGWLAGDDLAAAFHLADVLVAPSVCFDSFPTVNLEAMASKTPVVATCYGGSREAVQDGQTGYVINPFDTDELATKLTTLLADADLRQQMGQAGYEHVCTAFPIQRQRDAMFALYQQAIDQHTQHHNHR